MKLSLVSFLATDKVKLPGLLYEPDQKSSKVAVWLHGMGDNAVFYKPDLINALGESLTDKGISLLAFNNRGAHNAKNLKIANEALSEEDRYYQGGTFYELIEDCVKDIDGAVEFLSSKAYQTFYLLGHSTGANKICAYTDKKADSPFSKYVLAGPGDDIGLHFVELGAKKFWQALQYASKHAGHDDGSHIMPKYSGMYPFSAQAALDILNPDGAYNTFPYYEETRERLGSKELFKEYRQIDISTLIIIGEEDEYMETAGGADGALKVFTKYSSNQQLKKNDFQLVHGADHSFHDVELVFAKQVSEWLSA
jgi:alpha-beta hydrolase superfamily lysophospholipase